MTKKLRFNFDKDTMLRQYPDWIKNTCYAAFAELSEEHDISCKDLWDHFKVFEHMHIFKEEFAKHKIDFEFYDLRPFPSWGIEYSEETRVECILKYSDENLHE